MVTIADDSKMVYPFLPSLLHLASVQVAIPLCNNFDRGTLNTAYMGVKLGISFTRFPIQKAQKTLLLIPAHLRQSVKKAVRGLRYAARTWQNNQYHILKLKDEDCVFYWKSNGTIDGNQTAQHLVVNANIDIISRFIFACKYCLEESVKRLWGEMEASGATADLNTSYNSMVRFWARRMRHGSQVPWSQAITEFFKDPQNCHMGARYSSFFSSLRPEERKRFFSSITLSEDDDYLLCLHAMTKEEEAQILKERPAYLLCNYMEWPFRSLFLGTVEKMWKYIYERAFLFLVDCCRLDWEAIYLFEAFWKRSPVSFRERAKQIPLTRKKIDRYFSAIQNKRKAEFDRRNSKKTKF